MSSPASSSVVLGDEASKSKTSSPDRTIAFLVHSPDSVANNLPPDCDNKPLARQRRRRTSPDDQRILEEAFAKNPRPNKDERQEIIRKVALGDKEVQIWFQNRRQTSRRKAKPVDAHDAETHIAARSSSPPSSPIIRHVELDAPRVKQPANAVKLQAELSHEVTNEEIETQASAPQEPCEPEQGGAKEISLELSKNEQEMGDSLASTVAASMTSSQSQPASTFPTELSSSQEPLLSSQDALFTSLTRPTYLANRRSASFARQQTEEPPVGSQSSTQDAQIHELRKSGSYLRLSMTADGQARVIDRSAPSPPRPQPVATSPTTEQLPACGLRRSYSAAGLKDLFKQSAPEAVARTKVARISHAGRSRDSRAWEFWCDSEARSSLVNKAEQESSGSAADAIGLIRQSSRSVLRPNSRRANSPMLSKDSFAAMNAGKPVKAKLQRASTTYGRLQQQSYTSSKKDMEERSSPSGDSDKENWDPEDDHVGATSRFQLVKDGASSRRRGRTVLGENTQLPSYVSSLGGFLDAEKQREAGPVAVDAEVQSFMSASGENEDLDCVQSLLSLSKGNWR